VSGERSRFYDRSWFFLDWPLTIIFWLSVIGLIISAFVLGVWAS
jgi:hypothetical protein